VSKYLHFENVCFASRELLLAALADLGYPTVEEGVGLPLHGYQGDRRPETAEIVVRRRHVGSASNDIGFTKTGDRYAPILSEYDHRTLMDGQFLVRLRTAYSERVVEEVRRRLRGTARRTVEGGVVRIAVRF
jgi:hypothetical protein